MSSGFTAEMASNCAQGFLQGENTEASRREQGKLSLQEFLWIQTVIVTT